MKNQSNSLHVKIFNWNILAHTILIRDKYTFDGYDNSIEALETRYNILLQILSKHIKEKAIIGLQEVDSELIYSKLTLWLEEQNYKVRWGPCNKRSNNYMAEILAWPNDKYQTIEYSQFVLSDEIVNRHVYPEPSKLKKIFGWGKFMLKMVPIVNKWVPKEVEDPYVLALDRMNWLLMAKLRDLESGKEFVISVIHMPCLFMNDDVMMMFADVAAACLDEFAGENMPTILMGDFNIMPNSVVYNYITDKSKREYVVKDWEPLLKVEYSSAYALDHGEEPEYTNYTYLPSKHGAEPFKGTLDYVFIRKGNLPSKVNMAVIPEESIKGKLCPIPACPSDHLPMYGELVWE